MARITHCSVEDSQPRIVDDSYNSPASPIRIDMGADSWLRLTLAEAVQLRDDLSRAITEQAQKAAQATAEAAESEGAQA